MNTRSKKQTQTEGGNHPDLMVRDCAVEVRAAEGNAPAQVRMSVSSEEPVLTYVNMSGSWLRAYEILDHAPESIDMSRAKDGLVVLDRHYGDQVGLMALELNDRKLGGPVRFGHSQRSQDVSQDAAAGIRRNVSVGYQVDPASYRIEGEKDGIPVVRAMRWTPYEASFEPVPADPTVGVNRAGQIAHAAQSAATTKENRTMEPKEMAKLFARAAKFGIEAAAVEALVADGKGRAELDALIVDKQATDMLRKQKELEDAQKSKPATRAVDGQTAAVIEAPAVVTSSKQRAYSIVNVMRRLAGMKADDGFEREMSEECARLRGRPAEGFIVPYAALCKRDFTVSGSSSASVATMLDGYIDVLQTKYAIGRLGVQFLTGLVGNIAIPKMTAGATGYWIAEGADLTESQPTLGQVTGTPHGVGALVDVSRLLLIQSTPDAEEMVRNEVLNRVMRTVQIAVFAGTGADGQPSAITNATGINNPSVTQGTPTYAELLGFPGAIMADNAEADGQKWAMTAEVWAKLAATATNGAGSPLAIDATARKLVGFDYETTEDLPANSLWFGNWASVVLGVWGTGIDIATTDSRLFASGGLTVRALQYVDVMVRQGAALAYNTAVTS